MYQKYNNSAARVVSFYISPGMGLDVVCYTFWYMNNVFDVGIVTYSSTAEGANILKAAAEKVGMTARLCVIRDDDIVSIINANPEGIFLYRIKPSTYQFFVEIGNQVIPKARQPIQAVLDAFDKTVSADILSNKSIPTPHTSVIEHISQIESLQPPLIVKIPVGNQGKGVFLAKSKARLAELSQNLLAQEGKLVLQKYVAESAGKDKRLFVVGNEVIAAMQRTAADDEFRSNIHLGSTPKSYRPTPEEARLAVEATAAHKLSYAGVDIIDSADGPLVLEVNPSPGFAISKVTGVKVEEHILKFLKTSKRRQR